MTARTKPFWSHATAQQRNVGSKSEVANPASQPNIQRGFTLVEMLVVLILVGLITGILFQALSQVFHLQARAGGEMDKMRQNAMLSDWFRQVIHGVQPDYDDGKHKFQATGRTITGLTISPLTSTQGALSPFTLSLEFDNRRGETLLRYGEGEGSTVLMAWPGDKGQFVFVDEAQAEYEMWPPPMQKKLAPVPAFVRLEIQREGQPMILLAALSGPDQPRPRLRDLLGNSLR
jgi:prepilin-type N-terminal cleavage/methylation domain-containing protein